MQIAIIDYTPLEDIPSNTLEAFNAYHRQNPHIFDLFYYYAKVMRDAGRKQYGAKSIMERVRWHCEIENTGSEFKISNSFTAYYPRLVEAHDPSFKGFFVKKQLKGLGGE